MASTQTEGPPLYVNYGCGWAVGDDWLNFDASPTLRFERLPILGRLYHKNPRPFPTEVIYGDIVRGLPVPAESCRGIFASHVLEHLSLEDFQTAIKNTYALLRSGGLFRVVVPDLRALAQQYVQSQDPLAAGKFMRASGLGRERTSKSMLDLLVTCFGRSAHLWMWDFQSLRSELEDVGFRNIRRCFVGDAPDPMFKRVEVTERFNDAVAVEAQK